MQFDETRALSSADVRGGGLAVVATAAAVALTRFTWPLFAGAPFAPLFGAVAATSHWGTRRASLLAIVLAAAGSLVAFPSNVPPAWDPRTLIIFVPVALLGSYVITARNRAVAALRANDASLRATLAAQRQAERDLRASEQKLRHAQKMEAVGQLVAGVAHNFNNLLTVTMGYTDALLERHQAADAESADLREIRKATDRGAALTRQLLAFIHKHEPTPTRVDLTRTVADFREMLTRVIREDIELTIHVPSTPVVVMIDAHDIEQVILNLVLNARDALRAGGAIRIDVSRERIEAAGGRRDAAAAAGEYVRLRVRDNGTGMTEDVQAHLFEPFFTTKDVGQGAGLGLAFVHGIAQHAGGFVTIKSAPAMGTTVDVYLPPAPAASIELPVEKGPAVVRDGSSGATILLVEDEAGVRTLTARALSRAGYRVLAAASPTEASALFDRHSSEIDLLLTDVVMPEIHGPELAKRLVAQRPGLPVLFVSGYSDVMPAAPTPTDRTAFLPKPFAPSQLVATVAELLGAHQP